MKLVLVFMAVLFSGSMNAKTPVIKAESSGFSRSSLEDVIFLNGQKSSHETFEDHLQQLLSKVEVFEKKGQLPLELAYLARLIMNEHEDMTLMEAIEVLKKDLINFTK